MSGLVPFRFLCCRYTYRYIYRQYRRAPFKFAANAVSMHLVHSLPMPSYKGETSLTIQVDSLYRCSLNVVGNRYDRLCVLHQSLIND